MRPDYPTPEDTVCFACWEYHQKFRTFPNYNIWNIHAEIHRNKKEVATHQNVYYLIFTKILNL